MGEVYRARDTRLKRGGYFPACHSEVRFAAQQSHLLQQDDFVTQQAVFSISIVRYLCPARFPTNNVGEIRHNEHKPRAAIGDRSFM